MKLFKPILKHWSYLADLVVIILGIVIALSLDAWWQDKQERKLERHYLEQLYNECIDNEESLSQFLSTTLRYENSTIILQEVIHDNKLISDDSLGLLLINGLSSTDFTIINGTYISLIQSGHLKLITNAFLREELAAYGGKVESNVASYKYFAQNKSFLYTSSFFIEELNIFGFYNIEQKKQRRLPEGNRFPIDFSKLINDRRFASTINNLYMFKLNEKRELQHTLNITIELRKLLEKELGIENTEEQ